MALTCKGWSIGASTLVSCLWMNNYFFVDSRFCFLSELSHVYYLIIDIIKSLGLTLSCMFLGETSTGRCPPPTKELWIPLPCT